MLKKLLRGGWIRCPECGSEDVGFSDDTPHMWMERFECRECGESVSEMVGHG